MDRREWMAMLAKMVTPSEPQTAADLVGLLPLLRWHPDEMFCPASAVHVAKYGRVIMRDEGPTYHPLSRIPSYGELEAALGRWWHERGSWLAVDRHALPAPPDANSTWRAQAAIEWSDPANVSASLRGLEDHPMAPMLSKLIGAAVWRYAPQNIHLIPEEYRPDAEA